MMNPRTNELVEQGVYERKMGHTTMKVGEIHVRGNGTCREAGKHIDGKGLRAGAGLPGWKSHHVWLDR